MRYQLIDMLHYGMKGMNKGMLVITEGVRDIVHAVYQIYHWRKQILMDQAFVTNALIVMLC